MTIADTIRKALSEGKSNAEVLEIVKKAHPEANTSPACISYYRSKMKKAGSATSKAPKALKTASAYSVKGVKFFRGMEGYGFNATLYRDGVAIAFVYDDATGGEIAYEWKKNVDAAAEIALLKAHVADMPPIVGCGVSIPMDYNLYVDGLVQDAQLLKDAKKFIGKGVAFIVDKALYTSKSAPTEATYAQLRAKYPTAVIMNHMTDEQLIDAMRSVAK